MALAETAKTMVELGLRDKLSPGLATAGKNLGRFETGVGRVGKGFGQLSAGMTRAGTIVAGAAITGFGAAAKAAIDWQDQFTGVVKTVDEDSLAVGQSFRDIELGLRNLATEMPNTAQELAAIAEAGGAMGIAGKDIVEFTRQVAILGSTTNVSADEAAVALGQMQNVIGLATHEFDNFAAALVELGNEGNSTEAQILEIERRAAGAARLAGVAKEATLGWSAAAANLGLNEELAGTALQRFFVQTKVLVTEGGKDLDKMAKIAGKSAKDFRKAFRKDASGALEDFIKGLSGLSKGDRIKAIQDLFGKGTGLTRLLVGLSDSIDKNLTPSIEQSTKAWFEGAAAQEEFEKRNATVRSAIIRLRNGITDAAITVGEGFTPALGRAADKLAAFLKQDENRAALTKLGQDIGKAIDSIDWQEVLRGARTFVDVLKSSAVWAKRLYDLFNALPTEIKGSLAALLLLNKASGGLVGAGIGNIVGGIGETVTRSLGSKIPGIGRAFAQPVFVTNWPVGGMGGAAGAAGGASKGIGALGKVFLVGEAIGLAAAVEGTRQAISNASTEQATNIRNGLNTSIAGKSLPELRTALAATNTGIEQLQSNPLHALVQGDALTQLRGMRTDLQAQIAKVEGLRDQTDAGQSRAERGIERVKQAQAETKRETQRGLQATKAATQRGLQAAKAATDRDNSANQAVTRSGTAQVVGAIRRIPAPITNVRVYVTAGSVRQTVTTQNRVSGQTSGQNGPDAWGGEKP